MALTYCTASRQTSPPYICVSESRASCNQELSYPNTAAELGRGRPGRTWTTTIEKDLRVRNDQETPPISLEPTMAKGISSFLKSVVAPLAIAILLYAVLHALVPLYRRHRERYANYTPMLPEAVTSRISALIPTFISTPFEWFTDRLSNSLVLNLFTPSNWHAHSAAADRSFNWRYNPEAARHGINPFIARAADEEEVFDEEEGEGMVGFDVRGQQDSAAVPRPVDRERYAVQVTDAVHANDSGRRLSRELESGFKDDSDDDGGESDGRRTMTRTGLSI